MILSKHTLSLLSLTCLLALCPACGDDDGGEPSPGQEDGGGHTPSGGGGDAGPTAEPDAGGTTGIEIAGAWTSMYGDETITDTTWDNGYSVATIVRYDNDDNAAITMDPPTEDDGGVTEGSFGKVVWTELKGGAFYYCSVSFLEASAADAEAHAMAADDSDPANGGCGDGDFPWTKLEPK